MKFLLMFLLFMTLYCHVNCAYKTEYIMRDFKKSLKSLKAFMKKKLTDFKQAVAKLFDTKKSKKKTLRLGLDDSRDNFTNFLHSAWTSGETTKANTTRSNKLFQLTTPLLAEWHGRKMETHIIQTKDGYFLTAHRIPAEPNLRKRTVLLHHGLLGSSMDWLLLGPGPSTVLPYILADAGYDVWMMNARGNYYSRGHATLTVSMDEFWNFSFDEMGLVDIPAVLDYMRKQTNVAVPIDFVGYSMGATAFLVFLSSLIYYKRYLRVGILIAPLAFMNNVNGPMKILARVPGEIIKTMGEGEFLPKRKVPSWLARKYCVGSPVMCSNPLFFLSGVTGNNLNGSFIARLRDHVPAGASINTIKHYIQLIRNGKFHSFNNETNEYNIPSIDVPLALISSTDDWLAAVQDVQRIYYLVKNPINHFVLNHKNVTHTDFLWDNETSSLVFHNVLEYLEKGIKWDMMRENEVI